MAERMTAIKIRQIYEGRRPGWLRAPKQQDRRGDGRRLQPHTELLASDEWDRPDDNETRTSSKRFEGGGGDDAPVRASRRSSEGRIGSRIWWVSDHQAGNGHLRHPHRRRRRRPSFGASQQQPPTGGSTRTFPLNVEVPFFLVALPRHQPWPRADRVRSSTCPRCVASFRRTGRPGYLWRSSPHPSKRLLTKAWAAGISGRGRSSRTMPLPRPDARPDDGSKSPRRDRRAAPVARVPAGFGSRSGRRLWLQRMILPCKCGR